MVATTVDRVPQNTASDINNAIRQRTESNIRRYANTDASSIERRLQELDQQLDVERLIETEAPLMILSGLALGNLVKAMAAGMLLLHNLQGWYPLLPMLRRLGFRTEAEINEERYALKALRGDFAR